MKILSNFNEFLHFGGKKPLAIRPGSPKILMAVYIKTARIELLFQRDNLLNKGGNPGKHTLGLFHGKMLIMHIRSQ